MLEEFKKFALKGSVVDLAVGVIIGAAFGKIIDSLVTDMIMPLVGAVVGGFDFTNYFLPLKKSVTAIALADAKKQGAVLAWGNFLTVAINFVVVAWVLFLVVRPACSSTRRQSLRGRHARKCRSSRSAICSLTSEPPACLSHKARA